MGQLILEIIVRKKKKNFLKFQKIKIKQYIYIISLKIQEINFTI
jgi:hypothetical protein